MPDKKAALGRLSGDAEALHELAAIFLKQCPELMARIREAVASGSAPDLAAAAHTLKGSAGFVGADWTAEAALELELLARGGDLTRAAESLADLEEAVAASLPVMEAWTNG